MRIELHWKALHDYHELWLSNCAIYAYQHPRRSEILYIGKADGTTVRGRWAARDKLSGFWHDLETQRHLFAHRVLAADLLVDCRLTRQVLADVESLLISKVQPWGNISACRTRIERPGMEVVNVGSCWPGARRFRDV